MSLINDALKRAREAQPSTSTPETIAPMLRPVEYTRHSNNGAAYVSASLLVLGLGAWFLIKGWEATRRAAIPSVVQPTNAREPSLTDSAGHQTPALEEAASFQSVFQPAPLPSTTFVRDFRVEDPPSLSAPVTASTAPFPSATTPGFRLQAIFYRASRPSAVINGRTLFVGDRIDEAKVTAIARETVTLQAIGEKTVLTLY